MSLKSFHIFFLVIAIIFDLGMLAYAYLGDNSVTRELQSYGVGLGIIAGVPLFTPSGSFGKRPRRSLFNSFSGIKSPVSMSTFTTTACATCINQDGSADVVAANGAVFVMIGALGIVFLSMMAVLYSFVRRARRFAATQSN